MTTVTSMLCYGCFQYLCQGVEKLWVGKKTIALNGHELKLPVTENLIHVYAHTCTAQSGSSVVMFPSPIM